MAEKKKFIPRVTIEDARLIFRNFEGRGDQYNREGDRNFTVILPPELVEPMQKDGWNIRFLKPREEGDDPTPSIPVKVSYNPNARPPEVVIIKSNGRTYLDESLVGMLDHFDIKTVDVMLHPYVWEMNGKTGVKAYLHKIFVTINEDELDLKYADVPDAQKAVPSGPRFEEESPY